MWFSDVLWKLLIVNYLFVLISVKIDWFGVRVLLGSMFRFVMSLLCGVCMIVLLSVCCVWVSVVLCVCSVVIVLVLLLIVCVDVCCCFCVCVSDMVVLCWCIFV